MRVMERHMNVWRELRRPLTDAELAEIINSDDFEKIDFEISDDDSDETDIEMSDSENVEECTLVGTTRNLRIEESTLAEHIPDGEQEYYDISVPKNDEPDRSWKQSEEGTLIRISALKDVTVTIPQAASIGDTVTLQCRYDLEEEPLYTVKWYKGQREFFRFIPKELPSTQIFPFYGMEIDVSKSSKNAVVLRNIQQNITGKYICEVSTDAPNFYTISATGFMYVTHKPVGQPELVAERDALGYLLRGNCTSPSSYPAINLTWYLNGRQVNESFRIHIPDETTPTSDKRRPVMTMVGLEHVIEEDTYTAGNLLVVRCVANLFNLYQKDVQTVIHEEHPRPRPSSVLGTRGASSGSPTLGDLFVINAAILLAAIIR